MRGKKSKHHQASGPYEINRSIPTHSSYTPDTAMFQPSEPAKPRWKKILKRTVIIIVIIGALCGAWVGWKFLSNLAKIYGWGNLWSLLHPTKLKGEDRGQVNLLLAGNSADDPGHGGAELTDSIMLVSINPKDKKAFMLSIPRDLYVNIPNNGYAKINEAYQDGKNDNFHEPGYAEGGMGLLEKVVSEKFDLPIDYYALVDYAALKNAVDAVGGVTVDIQSSDPRGLYDPSPDLTTQKPLVDLQNGKQKLNGQQALGLARARGNSYSAYGFPRSDFNRTEHQRQILLALKDKASSVSTLSNPVKLGNLADSFGEHVDTDLNPGETRRLYSIVKSIPNGEIKSAGLNDADGEDLLTSYATRTGQSALAPRAGLDDYSEIQAFMHKLAGGSSSQ